MSDLNTDRTFTVNTIGKRFGFSKSHSFVNGQEVSEAKWSLNGQPELIIQSTVPGSWRILRDGRCGYFFEPKTPSHHSWVVLLER